MPPKELRVGVIGAGNMGRHHIRIYSELVAKSQLSNKPIKLVAIADFNPNAEELAVLHNAKYYKDYKEMICQEKLDAVSLVVPTSLHYQFAKELLEHGIHILIEKPIASTVEQGQDLMLIAKKSGRVAMTGHIEWFNPAVQRLREVIEFGLLGEIQMITAQRLGNNSNWGDGTGIILNLGVHDVHTICKLMGQSPKKVLCRGGSLRFNNKPAGSKEDFATMVMDFEKSHATINLCWFMDKKVRNLTVFGSKACAELDYINQELSIYALSKDHDIYKSNSYTDSLFFYQNAGNNRMFLEVERREPLKVEIEAFIAACRGEIPNPIPPEEATLALEICQEATSQLRRQNQWQH